MIAFTVQQSGGAVSVGGVRLLNAVYGGDDITKRATWTSSDSTVVEVHDPGDVVDPGGGLRPRARPLAERAARHRGRSPAVELPVCHHHGRRARRERVVTPW